MAPPPRRWVRPAPAGGLVRQRCVTSKNRGSPALASGRQPGSAVAITARRCRVVTSCSGVVFRRTETTLKQLLNNPCFLPNPGLHRFRRSRSFRRLFQSCFCCSRIVAKPFTPTPQSSVCLTHAAGRSGQYAPPRAPAVSARSSSPRSALYPKSRRLLLRVSCQFAAALPTTLL